MLAIKDIRENTDFYRQGLIKRGLFEGNTDLKKASQLCEQFPHFTV